jgi:hypothetical protein
MAHEAFRDPHHLRTTPSSIQRRVVIELIRNLLVLLVDMRAFNLDLSS